MTKRKTPKRASPSREFELLVRQIEAALVPQGVSVKSPDRIIDKYTGRKREVDVSLRYRLGSTEVLVAIECRKRSRRPDVQWIEQLPSKQQAIGAAKMVAVSPLPFSKGALLAAAARGIETRVLQEVTEDDISGWASKLVAKRLTLTLSEQAISIEREDETPMDDATSEWVASLVSEHAFAAQFITIHGVPDLQSPASILRQMEPHAGRVPLLPEAASVVLQPGEAMSFTDRAYRRFQNNLPEDGSSQPRSVSIGFPPKTAFIRYRSFSYGIRRVLLSCRASLTASVMPGPRTLRYESPEQAKADVLQYEFEIGGNRQLVISSVRRRDEDPP